MLIQYFNDCKHLIKPIYMPLSIQSSVFVQVELDLDLRVQQLVASLIGQKLQH